MKATISPEPALLGFLLDGPVHGYDLHKRVHDELGAVWHLGQSQTYAILNEYATRGWIRTRVEHQGARPSKKILELTPGGRKAFAAWMSQPAHGLREFRVDFFARLFFARALGRRETSRLLQEQIAECQRELDSLLQAPSDAAVVPDLFRQSLREFRIEQLQAALHWLEQNRKALTPRSNVVAKRPLTSRSGQKTKTGGR